MSQQQQEFEKGDQILYTSNTGEIELGVVINVHYDDHPPYYTIKLSRNNKDKVTDGKNLTLLEEDEDAEDQVEIQQTTEIKTTDETNQILQENVPSPKSNSVLASSTSFLYIATGLLLSLGMIVSYKYFKSSQHSLLKRF